MKFYGWLREGAVKKIANNKGGYRTAVTRYFMHVIKKYDYVLRVELQANVYSDDKNGYKDRVGDLVEASHTNNPVLVIMNEDYVSKDVPSDPALTNQDMATQELAMEKKNNKQENKAKKAMKKCGKAAEDAGA